MRMLSLVLFSMALFPSADLDSRVSFWKSVFTEHGEANLIFHDARHVHLVYRVVDLQKEGVRPDDAAGRRRVEARVREQIAGSLRAMAVQPQRQWSEDVRSVAAKVADSGVSDSPETLANRIHVQRGVRERFAAGLKRYGQYRAMVESILQSEGVPLELAALPLVESAYLNNALSRTGAAGIWQFMPSTARMFMKVTDVVDQRLDPEVATRSAARLLRKNHAALGSWPLAISAYNHGLSGISRARRECGNHLPTIIECYKGPAFGYASMNFYAEFVAALELLRAHQGQVPPSEFYRVQTGDTLGKLARRLGTSVSLLIAANGLKDPNRLVSGRVLVIPRG